MPMLRGAYAEPSAVHGTICTICTREHSSPSRAVLCVCALILLQDKRRDVEDEGRKREAKGRSESVRRNSGLAPSCAR